MRKSIIIPAITILALAFATSAEAGLLRRIASKVKNAVGRVAHVGHGHGGCTAGSCR